MDGDSTRGRLLAGATSAITPSSNGATKRSSSSASLALPPRPGSSTGHFPNPVTRTQSACFPVTRTPSATGLAMIKLTERTPPPTDMSWEDALATLHKLEKQLTADVQADIQKLRFRMTSSKIELVSRKSIRLYQMRMLLNTTRRLCREEEDIMGDFGGVKAVIDSAPRGQIDEDDYCSTKTKLLALGGKLTDIRRKQQRLAGQVEELQAAMRELVDMSQLSEIDGYEFNMESFKRESSALPEMPRLAPSLPSYSLFNHAPYSPSHSRAPSVMSVDSDRPFSASPIPPTLHEERLHRTVTVKVAVDSTDDEDLPSDAYLPHKRNQRQRKELGSGRRRYASSEVSDTESEDCIQVFQNQRPRMTPQEAKQKAEEDRLKAAEEEARIKQEVEMQLKREEEEEKKRLEEQEKKRKEDDEKKKAIMEAKQKAAAERAAELEAKKKAEEDKKKVEADSKRKEEQAKKKAENDAKKKKEEEEKKKKEEAAQKKKDEADAKKKAQEEAKQKKLEEAAKKKADEEAKKLAEEEAKAKAEEEKQQAAQAKKDAELRKKQAELEKKQAEEAKKQAELEKRQAEEAKKLAELERKQAAELEKKQAEESKKMAEQEKKQAAGAQKQAGALQRQQVEEENAQAVAQETKVPKFSHARQEMQQDLEEQPVRQRKKSADEAQRLQEELGNQKRTAESNKQRLEREAKAREARQSGANSRASGRESHQDDDMLYDPDQQLTSKEDLFAAISDTSLKGGKKLRQRRKLKAEEEYEDSDEDIPTKKQSYKSRTASKERPKSQEEVQRMEVEKPPSRASSRKSSRNEEPIEAMDMPDLAPVTRERPRSAQKTSQPVQEMEVEDSTSRGVKSRTTSRERPKTLNIPQAATAADTSMDFEESSRKSVKSRTASRERPKSSRSMEESSSLEFDDPTQITVKSRTASRERPRTLNLMGDSSSLEMDEPPPMRGAKSRTASRERPKLVEQPVRGQRSRTSSKDAADLPMPGKNDDMFSRAPKLSSRQASNEYGSRPPSRFSDMMSDNLDADLTWDDDEDEAMPSLAPMQGISGIQSRTDSRERADSKASRPASRGIPDLEHTSVIDSMPRPGSRTLAQEEELLKIASEEEARVARSRTSSRNRGDLRNASRERPQELYPDFDDSEFELEQQQAQQARGAKTRTQSRERAPGALSRGSFGEADQRPSSRERPQPLWPEEGSDNEISQQRTRSRTSSADRKRLVGGGRDELLAEDSGYDAVPSGPSPGGYRTYRDEVDLDTRQYNYAMGTQDPDSFQDAAEGFDDEDEPPPAEPIYQSQPRSSYFQEVADAARPSSAGAMGAQYDDRYHRAGETAQSHTSSNERLKVEEFGAQRSRTSSRDRLHQQESSQFSAARSRTSSREAMRPPASEEEYFLAEETLSTGSRASAMNRRQEALVDQRTKQNDAGYGYEDEKYGAEPEIDTMSRSSKKVSFAEADQKFHLKPDPDVKTLPGTRLFSFGPSSTHEQPPPPSDFNDFMPKPRVVEQTSGSSASATKPEEDDSTSPKAFLKAMAKGVKGQPKPREERGGSILDNLMRRGRSSSAQGSRSSSRQSSLDRAFSKPGGGGGSSRSDYSTASDNFEDMSEADSTGSFFRKKKKPKKVNTVDFDELFARGHAMALNKQLEQHQELNGSMMAQTTVPITPTTSAPTTSFEAYSKEEAFRKSQKAAGIGYAEKVQSYLTDQQTSSIGGHPFDAANDKGQKPTRGQPYTSPIAHMEPEEIQQIAMDMQDPLQTQSTHHRNHAVTMASLQPAIKNEERLVESHAASRRNSSIVVDQVKGVTSKSVSPAPSSVRSRKRQMTPQEFLAQIQDFVKNAEVEEPDGQAVWPAVIRSSETPTLRLKTSSRNSSLSRKTSEQIWPAVITSENEPQLTSTEAAKPTAMPPRPASAQDTRMSRAAVQQFLTGKTLPTPSKTPTATFDSGNSLSPPEAPPRQKSPRPGYQPKLRDHSPFLSNEPLLFESALKNPITKRPGDMPDEVPSLSEQLPSRIAPSPGKSYLDKPSTSPDPFGMRVEMDAPPSVTEAAATSSSILSGLKRQADQRRVPSRSGEMDDVITLDLRKNQEKIEYLSLPSDYRHKTQLQESPRRGRSPTKKTSLSSLPRSREDIPADAHIPMQLKPDPLTAHETVFRQTGSMILGQSLGDESIPSIQETDLYKKLKIGLDRLMSTDKFKELAESRTDINMEHQSYSQHLGRAEFGELRKRTSSYQGISNPIGMGRGSSVQPRDPSNERPASAMAKIGGSGERGGRRSNYSSQQPSRDSSLGRHDSRMSSNSNIPDLEVHQDLGHQEPLSTSGSVNTSMTTTNPQNQKMQQPTPVIKQQETSKLSSAPDQTFKIQPHPEVFEKKKEVLQALAIQNQAVKEAKVWVQVLLLFVLCFTILMYLQFGG